MANLEHYVINIGAIQYNKIDLLGKLNLKNPLVMNCEQSTLNILQLQGLCQWNV